MRNEILTYWDMCARERGSLQRGMYFRQPPATSVVLMSRRPSAPYEDSLSADGTELEYEGHDVRRAPGIEPKEVDQPFELPTGAPTENGLFAQAAVNFKEKQADPLRVRVYEKLRPGIWSDKGLFELIDYAYPKVSGRCVFRFRMRLAPEADEAPSEDGAAQHRRAIPSWVKQTVFKRDRGKCVICGALDDLHFDHDLPFSRGGASIVPENVRLLCARHNLQKAARIE